MDQSDAYSANFMKSTGFGANTMAKTPMAAAPPAVVTPSQLMGFHSDSGPNAPQHLPGTIQGGNPYTKGIETPQGGLVPGHMPLRSSLDTREKPVPFPSSDRLDKLPFVRGERGQLEDWRAVGVGKETSRRSPGRLAKSPPGQGRLDRLKEKFTGMEMPGDASIRGPVALACVGLATLFLWYMKRDQALLILSGVMFAAAGGLYYQTAGAAAATSVAATERALGNAVGDKNSGYISDTSRSQRYQPLAGSQRDHNPYPKHMDRMESTEQRLSQQGTDMNNMEGPRDGYKYKRGPTPANQQRLQTNELMRDASLYNMDKQEFGEYMARLEGEAPDRFHQAHAYHPFGPHWAHRNQVDDSETLHGISTQPGQMMRKSKYIEPRIQQAAARTSHLKDPPPGSAEPLRKTHPWMEKQAGEPMGQSFDMDNYERAQAQMGGARSSMSGSSQPFDTGSQQTRMGKLDANDAADFVNQRMAETKMFAGPEMGNKDPDDLPPGLEPVPTTRKGMAELEQRKLKQAQSKQTQQQDQRRQMSEGYEQNQQQNIPHPRQSAISQPSMYEGMKGEPTMDDLASAFSTKNQPSESQVSEAMSDVRR